MLEKVLKRSDALDREALCIVAGQRVRVFLPFLPIPFPFPSPFLLNLVQGVLFLPRTSTLLLGRLIY